MDRAFVRAAVAVACVMSLSVALSAPSVVMAQARPVPMVRYAATLTSTRAIEVGKTTPFDASITSSRGARARRGAVIGAAVLGVTAGTLAYFYAPIGCDVTASSGTCNEQRERVKAAAYMTGVGVVAGALTGGVIGAVVPTRVETAR